MTKLQKELEERFEKKKALLVKEMNELSETIAHGARRVESAKIMDSFLGIDCTPNQSISYVNNLIRELSTVMDIMHRSLILEIREPENGE